MVILSHPTANTFVRQAALSLCEAGLLDEFWTCVSWNPDSVLARLAPPRLRAQMGRRAFEAALQSKVHARPWREIGRLFAPSLRLGALTAHESGIFSVDAVYQDLDRAVARRLQHKNRLSGVYAYEDGARDTFRRAKTRGLTRFYELPIAYWETSARLLREEAERWPEWEPTLGATRDGAAKTARKTEELELADVVVVPSRFVLDSLPASVRQSKRCIVAPFGSPVLPDAALPETDFKRPLRALFAGSLTQRKGLADVFAAMKMLNRSDVELVVLGTPVAPLEFYRAQGDFRFEAPRPHAQVLELMRSCDVLVLPSIVEGRALVQQEAMACGLPLLITPHTGGDDLIVEGETGFLVPVRAPAKIAEKLAWLADNRGALGEMKRCARAKAAQYTWANYGAIIAQAVRSRGTESGENAQKPL